MAHAQLRSTIAMIVGIGFVSSPALATFPGENGRIAYVDAVDPFTSNNRRAVFLTGSGQLTFPRGEYPNVEFDLYPAWSPDGSSVAFVRTDSLKDYLMVVGKDGTGLRTIVSSDSFPRNAPNGYIFAKFVTPSWSPDGQRIAFVLRYTFAGSYDSYHGIWTIRTDGTGLSQPVRDLNASGPSWSPSANEIVYNCRFRPRQDLCIVDTSTRVIRQLPIDPGGLSIHFGGAGAGRPRWSPDGATIVFAYVFYDDQDVRRSEIFSVHADGTGLEALTHSPVACLRGGEYPGSGLASLQFTEPAPSPDGAWIVAQARHWIGTAERCTALGDAGLWILSAQGGHATLLVADDTLPQDLITQPDWQPILGNLVVTIDDGHGNVLNGLKVELRTLDGTPLDAEPINTAGGRYVFENGIPPGDYVLRATLIDHAGAPDSTPAFDIRHAGTSAEPAWIDHGFTMTDADSLDLTIPFVDSPALLDTDVADASRLDDLANLYFRVRQFVDWVKTRLVADTGPTVEFYAFAIVDPWDGEDVGGSTAYYESTNTAVVVSVLESEYENRDGVTGEELVYDEAHELLQGHPDDGPENCEWHEFTHHLYHQFVTDRASCASGFINHGGYHNPDTCDSMDEGFAAFLPMVAALDIEEEADAHYDHLAFNFDHVKFKPWGYRDPWAFKEVVEPTTEEFAVAGLFWDLVDTQTDLVATEVVAANRSHRTVAYRDQVSIPVRQIWNQLRSAHPATVFDLRRSFGSLSPTVDLDLDGLLDVAPVDEVFLLHGFFPIDTDQGITDLHKTHHYDVAYAQRLNASAARNGAVGLTSHHVYDSSGALTQTLVPRSNVPAQPRAGLEIHVLDASGFPVSGAALGMTIRYPGGREATVSRQLSTGDGAHIHVELPPYFDYLLPSGAPLPACDPAHDFRVEVVLSATVGDDMSSETPSFDNCTYQRAMANATGPAALSFTLTVPVIGTVTHTLTLDSTGTGSGGVTGGGRYRDGETALVYATADGGSTFTGWSGPDAAECATGSVHMTADKSCTATFTLDTHTLTVLTTGTGSGTVAGGGIYRAGQTAVVSATADAGSTFTGWSGPDAAECATGSVLVTTDKSCTATFALNTSHSFSGFVQPVDNPPSLNSVKAGSAVPVKFSLGGNRGLNIFAAGFPASGAVPCSATVAVDEIESTVTAGGSSLTYDPTTDQYTYVWKTDNAWAGQCRQLVVRLDDGSSHVANFKLR